MTQSNVDDAQWDTIFVNKNLFLVPLRQNGPSFYDFESVWVVGSNGLIGHTPTEDESSKWVLEFFSCFWRMSDLWEKYSHSTIAPDSLHSTINSPAPRHFTNWPSSSHDTVSVFEQNAINKVSLYFTLLSSLSFLFFATMKCNNSTQRHSKRGTDVETLSGTMEWIRNYFP